MGSKPKGLGYQAGMNAVEYEIAKLRASVDGKLQEISDGIAAVRFSPSVGEQHAGLLKLQHQLSWCMGRVHEIKMLAWILQHPDWVIVRKRHANTDTKNHGTQGEEPPQDQVRPGR